MINNVNRFREAKHLFARLIAGVSFSLIAAVLESAGRIVGL